jgi:hypothetical protein
MLPKRRGAFVAKPDEPPVFRRAPCSSRAFVLPRTTVVNADPAYLESPRVCESCGSDSLTHGRLSASELDRVEMFACDDCGDFWFERHGARLTADALRELGLI